MAAIVQINFDFEVTHEELLQGAKDVAPKIAAVEGLLWKIWLVDDDKKGSGGIYLFDSMEKAREYAESDIVASLRRDRTNVIVKVFDILVEPSGITRAPLPAVT